MGAQGSQEVGTPLQNEQTWIKNRWIFFRKSEKMAGIPPCFLNGSEKYSGEDRRRSTKIAIVAPWKNTVIYNVFTTETGRGPHRAGPEFHRTPLRLTHVSGFKNPAQK